MATICSPPAPSRGPQHLCLRGVPVAAVLAAALVVPMLVSGLIFQTYDIAMTSLPLEILRQLNAPFVLAELIVCAWAFGHGFRLREAVVALDKPARIALAVFAATFWIGGAFVSKAAPFATLFNVTYAVHFAFLAAVTHLARGWSTSDTVVLGRLISLALVGFCAMIAVRFLYPPTGRAIESIQWQFAIPGFISVRLFGAVAGAWAVFMLLLATTRGHEPGVRGWVFAACTLTVGMVVWSGTRAAVLGIGVAGAIALLRWRFALQPKLVAKAIAAALFGCGIAVLLLPYDDHAFWLFLPADLQGDADAVASGRLALWLASWNAFREVALFGAGPGASAWILPKGIASHIQPHNFIIEFLLNWGAVATAAALLLLAKLTILAHRRVRGVPAAAMLLLAADSLLAMALLDGTLHFAQHVMLWAALMGMALGATTTTIEPARATG